MLIKYVISIVLKIHHLNCFQKELKNPENFWWGALSLSLQRRLFVVCLECLASQAAPFLPFMGHDPTLLRPCFLASALLHPVNALIRPCSSVVCSLAGWLPLHFGASLSGVWTFCAVLFGVQSLFGRRLAFISSGEYLCECVRVCASIVCVCVCVRWHLTPFKVCFALFCK